MYAVSPHRKGSLFKGGNMTVEQKKKLLKAKVAVALYHEKGRVPTEAEIEHHFLHIRVSYKAVLGLHYKRKEMKKANQLPIF
jgi:hypothetical protein